MLVLGAHPPPAADVGQPPPPTARRKCSLPLLL